MSTNRNQSQIAEVRDQLSIDYADGRYLNVATANLGLTRPVFGFDDDTWRAVTKVLALQYRQILTKFHDVLEIVLGPQVTAVATPTEAVVVGDKSVVVNDTSDLPQVGTLVFDEGMISEETLQYCFIDRGSNTLFFEGTATQAHALVTNDVEAPLFFPTTAGTSTLQVDPTEAVKMTVPVTVVLGRGTASEETLIVTAVDTTTGVITLASPTVNDHLGLTPTAIQDELSLDYTANAEYLSLTSTSKFADEGYVLLGASSTSFTATGGSVTTVTYTSGDLTQDRHQGNLFVFDGNVTAGLAGEIAYVESNSSATTATFQNTLPFAPAAGDTFTVRPILRYTRNVISDNALQLSRDISDAAFSAGTEVEFLSNIETLAQAPIKVAGAGWDVIQSDPRNVEILIPEDLQDTNDLRSASYFHEAALSPTPTTTLATGASISDTELDLVDASDFPPAGNLIIDFGGGSEERLGYKRQQVIDTFVSAGSTASLLNVTTGGLPVGAYAGATLYIGGISDALNTSREITTNAAGSFTLDDPLTNEQFALLVDGTTELWVYHEALVDIVNQAVAITHIAAETVDYSQVAVATTLQSGDLWNLPSVFSGPYLYDVGQDAPSETTTTLNDHLAGPTTVVLSASLGQTALEVANATSFPLGPVSPYTVLVGRDTGNRELVIVNEVSLKQRTATTVAAPGSSIGATSVPVTALAGGGVSDDFPDARGYRVLIDRDGANEEVLYVVGATTGPDALTVEPATSAHVAGEKVELLADVLLVDPLDDSHTGSIITNDRTVRFVGRPVVTLGASAGVADISVTVSSVADLPDTGRIRIGGEDYTYSLGVGLLVNILDPGGIRIAASATDPVYLLTADASAEMVEVYYDEITLASTTGFPTTGGDIFLNFGTGVLSASSPLGTAVAVTDTFIFLDDTSEFPQTYPYEVIVDEGAGEFEERVLVIDNNTGLNRLTVDADGPARFSHDIGSTVSFYAGNQQKLTYSSVVGSTLRFSTPAVLQSTHQPTESVVRTLGLSIPRTTGYDFPLRMPTDLLFRIQFLFDWIRAAGVQVTIIQQR